MIQIKKKIPMPNGGRGKNGIYPWKDMVVGDCFDSETKMGPSSLHAAGAGWAMRHNKDWKFTTRQLPNGHARIWRVK